MKRKLLKPCARFNKITDIDAEFLLKKNIKGLIIDFDNTLVDFKYNEIPKLDKWIKTIKENNISICIATNSTKKGKVEKLANSADIPYICFSLKPLLFGLKKAKKILNLESQNIAEIGDQLFTDVLGANRLKMYSILTDPIEKKEKNMLNELKRKLERHILKKEDNK